MMTTQQRSVAGIALAKRVLEYFTDGPIEPFLECDIEVREMARAVLCGTVFVPSPTASHDHRELERSFAYSDAAGIIDCHCRIERDGQAVIEDWWSDTSDADPKEEVNNAVIYLETRGLIERHSEHPEWVRVRDETEAVEVSGPSPIEKRLEVAS